MRYIITLLGILLTFSLFGQTGGLRIKGINASNGKTIEIYAELFKDSVFITKGSSAKDGDLQLDSLPIGILQVYVRPKKGKFIAQNVFIQEHQFYQMVVKLEAQTINANSTESFDIGSSGQEIDLNVGAPAIIPTQASASGTNYINANYTPTKSGVMELTSVQCVAYREPLIRLTGGNSVKITREDLSRLPTRSVAGIASTVGGITQNELNQELHIRGARAGSNAYYIDGVRTNDIYGIPNTSINTITVIPGGIPANYGDLTGGVISVESKSYFDLLSERGGNHSYSSPTPSRSNTRRTETYTPKPSLNLDRFAAIYENSFLSTVAHPNSTFGIDVDRASWTYVQRRFQDRASISRDAVKLEEMINAFDYGKPEVPEGDLMHVELKRNPCLWNDSSELISIHLQAQELPEDVIRKPHNFVFLIDVSGSMNAHDKLDLAKSGMINFVKNLSPQDRIAIVTYSNTIQVPLLSTKCEEKETIIKVIRSLYASGSTNGSGGIQMAYKIAEENYDPNLNNRIILCTDGDFNVGISNAGDLEKYIAQKRGSGVYLTALGFGMGNYRNDILESLADRGDGNHFYINSLKECKRVLVEEMGNLINIARDVKLNVEFNPKLVQEYRLIGYENRLLKPRDFEDDTKDAGEIGYGHSVTAVYEIKRGVSETAKSHFTKTKIKSSKKELAYVRLRYKAFEDTASIERQYTLLEEQEPEENELLNIVASFGLLLRDSMFKGSITPSKLKQVAKGITPKNEDEKQLMEMIQSL